MSRKKPVPQIERILEEHVSLPHLEILVSDGCDRNAILVALQLAFLTEGSWKKLVGMDLRAFKKVLRQIRGCAGIIDRLNQSELIYRLAIEHRDPVFVGIHESPTLAQRLREYASLLENKRQLFGPKRKLRAHMWKAWVVAHVIEDTKRPHDREVSSLIAAILDDARYSEKTHQAWRLKHSDKIEIMVRKLREHRHGTL